MGNVKKLTDISLKFHRHTEVTTNETHSNNGSRVVLKWTIQIDMFNKETFWSVHVERDRDEGGRERASEVDSEGKKEPK